MKRGIKLEDSWRSDLFNLVKFKTIGEINLEVKYGVNMKIKN